MNTWEKSLRYVSISAHPLLKKFHNLLYTIIHITGISFQHKLWGFWFFILRVNPSKTYRKENKNIRWLLPNDDFILMLFTDSFLYINQHNRQEHGVLASLILEFLGSSAGFFFITLFTNHSIWQHQTSAFSCIYIAVFCWWSYLIFTVNKEKSTSRKNCTHQARVSHASTSCHYQLTVALKKLIKDEKILQTSSIHVNSVIPPSSTLK